MSHRMFLDRKSTTFLILADQVLPKIGRIREDLERYIGELPVLEFVHEILSKELSEEQAYDSDSESLAITEIEAYEDVEVLAKRLIDDLDSLPWSYTFTIKFHEELSEAFLPLLNNNDISDNLRIFQPDGIFEKSYPLTTGTKELDRTRLGLGLLSFVTDEKWDAESLYIQFKYDGFVGVL